MAERARARILVAEDDRDTRRALSSILGDIGYEVLIARDRREALKALRGGDFDMVVVDLALLGKREVDVLTPVRRSAGDCPIVVIADSYPLAATTDALRLETFDYLIRPVRRERVERIAREALLRRSITLENRRLAQENRDYRQQLEERVAERTVELEATNRELEAFSYSVSHDLRAPARLIDGMVRILLRDHEREVPEAVSECLRLVRASARRMGALVDDLLDFSRAGRQPLSTRRVAPESLVREVVESLRAEEGGRTIDIDVGELPACEADPVLLREVFVNLLSNAFKFTRTRELARIEVGATQMKDGNVYFVRDNGIGFDPAYSDRLFHVFDRLHESPEYEGTGIGLSIVQRIVERHGGRIWAKADVDEGATFYFTLPSQR